MQVAVNDYTFDELLDGLAALRVERVNGLCACVIRDSHWPWKSATCARERKLVLSRLFGKFAGRMVWLDSRFAEAAAALNQRSEHEAMGDSDWCAWFDLDLPTLDVLVDSAVGGWACVFSSTPPAHIHPVTPLPMEPRGVTELLANLSGSAIVASEIDEEFWIVALRSEQLTTPVALIS